MYRGVWSSIAHCQRQGPICTCHEAMIDAKGLIPLELDHDFGEGLRIHAHVGAQSTTGLTHRAGLGKARYLETTQCWIRRHFELAKTRR